MAIDDGRDPLERATRAVRDDETPGWVEVSQSIRSRVRSVVRPAPTLTAFDATGRTEHGDRGSRLHVSERVTDDRCSTIHIGLVCVYGSDLQAEGAQVRAAIVEVLSDLLGPDPAFDPSRDIDIQIIDVVESDPHRE